MDVSHVIIQYDLLLLIDIFSGNDDSYDEQEQPKVPESLAEELDRHQLTDNYRPSNWGGSGGDWCS